MLPDQFICLCAFIGQILAFSSLLALVFSTSEYAILLTSRILVGNLVALGTIMLVSASRQMPCTLSCGVTLSILMIGLIVSQQRSRLFVS